jgi:hypothetical protein
MRPYFKHSHTRLVLHSWWGSFWLLGAGTLLALFMVTLGVPAVGAVYPYACEKTITPDQDLAAIVNADLPSLATNFCVEPGVYEVSDTAVLRSGDAISGPIGSQVQRGPALYGQPTARLVGDTVDTVLSMSGANVSAAWLDISGADGRIDMSKDHSQCPASPLPDGCPIVGSGTGLGMGAANGTASVSFLYLHDNDAVGISNAVGRIKNMHTARNTLNSAFLGVNGSGIKGVREFEVSGSYVHNEQGNGIWHDHALTTNGDIPEMSSNPGGGTWIHHNVVVQSGRWGVRFEYSPRDADEGEHLPTPTFRAEGNRIAANKGGGASHADAQNGEWVGNIFGPQTIASIAYPANGNNRAIAFIDSGRSDRTDLWNADAYSNTLKGETLSGCGRPDTVVDCR